MERIPGMLALLSLIAAAAAAQDQPVLPAVGTAAPLVTLPSESGQPISLEQYRGKWVVLYFYPKDFTSGCTIEAHNFQRDLAKYEAKNAVILGVSLDSVGSHQGFCAQEGLHFKLLSDTQHVVTARYGALKTRDGSLYAARTTFLIDPKGVIRKVYEKVNPNQHSEQVLADLEELQGRR